MAAENLLENDTKSIQPTEQMITKEKQPKSDEVKYFVSTQKPITSQEQDPPKVDSPNETQPELEPVQESLGANLEADCQKLQSEALAKIDVVIAEVGNGQTEQPDGKLDSDANLPEVGPDSPKNSKKIFVVQKQPGNGDKNLIIKERLKYEDDLNLDAEISVWLESQRAEISRWLSSKDEDFSQLPGVEHILIKLGSTTDLLENVKLEKIRVKEVIGLGVFLICNNEKMAKDLYKKQESRFLLFPLRFLPNRIREEEFRSELCFMEGIRPQKTIAIAARFIQTHLGFGRPGGNLFLGLKSKRTRPWTLQKKGEIILDF